MSLWAISGTDIKHHCVGHVYQLFENSDQDFYPSNPETFTTKGVDSDDLFSDEFVRLEKTNLNDIMTTNTGPDLDLEELLLVEDLAAFDAAMREKQYQSHPSNDKELNVSSEFSYDSLNALYNTSGPTVDNTNESSVLTTGVCSKISSSDNTILSSSSQLRESSVLTTLKTPNLLASGSESLSSVISVNDFCDNNEEFQDLSGLMQQDVFSFPGVSSPSFDDNDAHSCTSHTVLEEFSTSEDSVCTLESVKVKGKRSHKSFSSYENFCTEHKIKVPKHSFTENPTFSDNSYHTMRKKNNEASRKSRMTRKEKEREMEVQAEHLDTENNMLRIRVQRLEEVIADLKQYLINVIVKK
ncbi:uncharacterized protein LOC143241974 [Tachypleus tridentatus]|uniref:uncharacterized protein LOC143241974 n=1 Tax=Tachypleus tridentatus TaxID=6853 RepID=UPI003FCFBC5B